MLRLCNQGVTTYPVRGWIPDQSEVLPMAYSALTAITSLPRECSMPDAHPHHPVEILLVEDSPDDAELMTDALLEGSLPVRIHLVEDGQAAMDYLCRHGPHEHATPPDLILLDLYLPRKNGHEVLSEIKSDPDLRQIPVVILSASDEEKDYTRAYDEHANCCVSKPVAPEEFARAVEQIQRFWLSIASRSRGHGGNDPATSA